MSEPTNGIWSQWTADKYHQSSPKLAAFMAAQLTVTSNRMIMDFGCGNAFYCAELANMGFNCLGIEGFKLNNFLHRDVEIHDLTKPLELGCRGHVISLEVGEHLPKSAEQTFLDTITKHCEGLLFMSWALPGQPGIGHINCQPQEYICDEICRRGFSFLPQMTIEARESHIDDNTDWFRRTLMIFRRRV